MTNSDLHLMATMCVAEQAGKVMKLGGDPAEFAALLAASASIARNAALHSAPTGKAVQVDQRIAELVALVAQTDAELRMVKP